MKKMKTVLFLIPTLAHGGAERVLVNLVNSLDKAKYDVTVMTLFDIGINKMYLSDTVHYQSVFKKPFPANSHIMKLFSPKTLYKHFITQRYDIVVSYLEGPTARIISGCPDPNTKKMCWVHIELNDIAKYIKGFRSKKEADNCYLDFDQIVCVSNSVKNVFTSTTGLSFPNINVIYNTNDCARIRELSNDHVEDVSFDNEQVNVCSVAKLMPSKGFDRLVLAHKRLITEGFRHNIYIIGSGEERRNLENEIAKEGITDTFHLLGFKENPYKYMKACDLYVCSSRREGFSTAVTEALILGKPVVSTLCSGACELLGEHDEYGIVTENSEEGIYRGLKKMLGTPGLIDYYAGKAGERGKKFDSQVTVKAVEDMFERQMHD